MRILHTPVCHTAADENAKAKGRCFQMSNGFLQLVGRLSSLVEDEKWWHSRRGQSPMSTLDRWFTLRWQLAKLSVFAVCFLAPAPALAQAISLDAARSLLDRGELAQAREMLQMVYPVRQDSEFQFLMGKLCFLWGEFDKAAGWLKKACTGNPNNSEYFLWLGRAEGRKAEKASIFTAPSLARKARDAFQKSVILDPENMDARDDLLNYYLEAPGFLGGGKEEARSLVEEIRTAFPCQYHVQLAEIYRHNKDFPQAEQELQKAIQVESRCLKGYVALAHFYQRQGQMTLAKSTFDKVAQLFPSSSQAHFAVGRFEVESKGDLKDASRELDLSLRTYVSGEPYPFETYHWLGLAFLLMKEPVKALQEFQLSLRLFPAHEASKKGIEKVRSLR